MEGVRRSWPEIMRGIGGMTLGIFCFCSRNIFKNCWNQPFAKKNVRTGKYRGATIIKLVIVAQHIGFQPESRWKPGTPVHFQKTHI